MAVDPKLVRNRTVGGIFFLVLSLLLAVGSFALSYEKVVALLIGAPVGTVWGVHEFRSRRLVGAQQRWTALKHDVRNVGRLLLETLVVGSVLLALQLAPQEWFGLFGLVAAGGAAGFGLKLLLVGRVVDSEFPDADFGSRGL